MNELFKGIAVLLTVIVAIVITGLSAVLVLSWLPFLFFFRAGFDEVMAVTILLPLIALFTWLLLVASTVEIALVWLLVLLDIISRRHGLIATLVLFILVGIGVFMASLAASVASTLPPGKAAPPQPLQ